MKGPCLLGLHFTSDGGKEVRVITGREMKSTCTCVQVHVCMSVRVCASVHVCMCACVHVCMSIRMGDRIQIHRVPDHCNKGLGSCT